MKKLSFLLAFVLLFSFCLGACGQPQPNPKLDDLNLLCETLETEHYDLYANVSEEEFQDEREKIARQTPNMTDAEFYWSVRHLLSLVGDAHTTVYPSDYFMSVLPWNIKKFDEGWFILILDKAHEQYLGTRVVAINDIPIDEVVERTRQVVSYEADTWLWQKAPDVLGWKEALEYLDIVEPDEPVLVTVETAQGAEESFELPAYDDWSDEKKQEVLVGFQRDSVPVTAEQDAIYWSTALDENTYFIQYNSCKEDPDLPMAQFVQQVEAALAQVPETERREAVEYIFHQPLEHKRNPTVYWMFVAVHGVVMPYLKDLTAEEARDLQWWYERSYPRREQTPVQRRLVALLKKMR